MTWAKARKAALKRAEHRCEKCGAQQADIAEPLHIHHLDRDHENNAPENLAVRCPPCHREDHQPVFTITHVGRPSPQALAAAVRAVVKEKVR